ncbi:MAG: Glyoxalase/bleomycin resistance protein/dioxygenase [Betaproteobacteria bacterium]|nr:Glyoxalase/bleomycin resistance protein/dioxygenase [Betaproteobacteria bacterium]
MSNTLFHFSVAVNDLDRARKFYGDMLQCPEGRRVKGRLDFNFFGHHIVAHLAPDEAIGDKGRKIGGALATPLRHFGVVMTLEDFQKAAARLEQAGAHWINKPSVTQKGTVREQMLMTVSDECGNAIEFKGLSMITDVYAVRENETISA